ncbi:MAG: hypothetical protein K0Q53_1411 [Massilibacillus sp.]|jgi:hypothetical protein|nr:hypothetical protein [Massilibacillus sp.]
MNLKNYFFVALLIFLVGLFGLHTGINHPSADKTPIMHHDQGHSMHMDNGAK